MAKEKKLPATIYIRWENDGDNAYLVAFDNIKDMADLDREEENSLVGIYKLTETGKIEVVVTLAKS